MVLRFFFVIALVFTSSVGCSSTMGDTNQESRTPEKEVTPYMKYAMEQTKPFLKHVFADKNLYDEFILSLQGLEEDQDSVLKFSKRVGFKVDSEMLSVLEFSNGEYPDGSLEYTIGGKTYKSR